MEILNVIADIIISLGVFFLLVGSIGLIRLPDFYSRSHATGKADTLGIMLVVFGLILSQISQYIMLHEPGKLTNIAKLLLIIVFVGLTNPTATNALNRAAFRFRLIPWFKKDKAKTSGKKKEGKK